MVRMNELQEFVDPDEPRLMQLKPCRSDCIRNTWKGDYGEARCEWCGTRFTRRQHHSKYCSSACKEKARWRRRRKRR